MKYYVRFYFFLSTWQKRESRLQTLVYILVELVGFPEEEAVVLTGMEQIWVNKWNHYMQSHDQVTQI